ncbi:MAG: sigma-54 interaction domain-containing protein [Desulfobacteraceae bacterium]
MREKDYHTMVHAFVGEHPAIEKIRNLVEMVADTGFNVLITGETGTGKEVLARFLHNRSSRRNKRFVKVNCGALPATLLESELFGYEKGAFTGAERRKPGKFELASGGVMFLDEIGDMPHPLQSKMLEVLQSSSFHRLGGTAEVKVDAWVIASTNRELEKEIKTGGFREDLYYRLNVIKVEIPPLRERKEDIPLLVEHLAARYREGLGLDREFRLSPALEGLFQGHDWPGNVRELANMVLRLMVGESPEEVRREMLGEAAPEPLPGVPDPLTAHAEGGRIAMKELKAKAETAIETRAIAYALRTTGGNKRQAARMLGISYKTLYNKLAHLGMEEE